VTPNARAGAVNVYLVVAVSAVVACEPLAASEPLQPPEAAHEVALLRTRSKVEAAPLATVLDWRST